MDERLKSEEYRKELHLKLIPEGSKIKPDITINIPTERKCRKQEQEVKK